MEQSSSKNFQNSENDAQSSPEGEIDTDGVNPIQINVSFRRNEDDVEKKEGSYSAPLPSNCIQQINGNYKHDTSKNILTEEAKKKDSQPEFPMAESLVSMERTNVTTLEQNKNDPTSTSTLVLTETYEDNINELLACSNVYETNVVTSEKDINKAAKNSMQKLFETSKNFSVIFTYLFRQRPRQPFRGQPNTEAPPPPAYYPRGSSRHQTQSQAQRSHQSQLSQHSQQSQQRFQQQSQQSQAQNRQLVMVHRYDVPIYHPLAQLTPFPLYMTHGAHWASYPSRIPDNVPAALAHLLDAEVLFVIQQGDAFEFLTGVPEQNFFIVLNKNGECILYAYETSDICANSLCGHTRGFQLHFMDVYHNEVILMNKPCGCTYCCCCFPFMEVYSPPANPLGAVTKMCIKCREIFAIMDVDENIMFTVHGDTGGGTFWRYRDADITIHALDSNRTQVGFIRREFISSPIAALTGVDYYGISFPRNMDVKIKALFLGALFLIDAMYFESDSGYCSCLDC